MATYNGEKYIGEQLDSILIQLSEDDEVVISDDSSTDRTVAIIKEFRDARIVLFENQKFSSPVFNFENSLSYAKGDIIILSDQDDIWKADKIAVLTLYFNKFDLILSDAEVVDKYCNIIEDSFYSKNGSKKGLVKNIIKNSYLGCTMAFNRNILEKALPFPRDLPMHDWWIGLVGELYGETYFIKNKLISYRRHDNNASTTSEKSEYSFTRKVFFRLSIIKNLILLKLKRP
jgi:glycosyltransferase involved in cell wall biosynthesis